MSFEPTFPELTVKEVLDACRFHGCLVTEDDLLHPTAATAQGIYEWWLYRILGLNTEHCRQAAEQQLAEMEHPEIYREAMYLGVFQRVLNQLLTRALIDDFSIEDLTSPTSRRLLHVVSGIVNFFLFEKEQAAEYLDPLQAEDEELQTRLDAVTAARDQKMAEIAAIASRTAENAPKIAKLKETIRENEKMLNNFSSVSNKNRKEYETLKKKGIALQDQLQTLESDIAKRRLEVSQMQALVVRSPARLLRDLDELRVTARAEEEKLREYEARELTLTAKSDKLMQYRAELNACVRLLVEIRTARAGLAAARAAYAKHLDESDALDAQKKDLTRELTIVQQRIDIAIEELARFEEKSNAKRAAQRERKRELESQYKELTERRREYDLRAAQINKEAVDIESEIRAMHKIVQDELDRGEVAFLGIRNQVESYSIKINQAIKALNEVNEEPLDLD